MTEGLTDHERSAGIIIAGTARCLWDDLRRCPPELPILGVNYAGLFIPGPRLQHMASYHAAAIGLLSLVRASFVPRPYGTMTDRTPPEVHSTQASLGVTRVWPEADGGGGSSGLFAVRVALGLGYLSIILAGMPLDGTGHFYDAPDYPAYDLGGTYLDAWVQALPALQGTVVSCSGTSKLLLGGLPE